MTVVELRKLARQNGVKLSAGIDKAGIVQRLAEALSIPMPGDAAEAAPVPAEHADEPDTKEKEAEAEETREEPEKKEAESQLQQAALSADVTSVQPSSTWNRPEENRRPAAQPAYRQAWQAAHAPAAAAAPARPAARPTAWQQRVMNSAPQRFGPQATYSAPEPEEPKRFAEPQRVPESAPRLDGYRLGYRAAPQRQDYGRNDYQPRGAYRQSQRGDYQPRYNNSGYGYQQPQQGYAQPGGYQPQRGASEVYYNDALYKPTRDPAFVDGVERGQPVPDMLQVGEEQEAKGILEILPDGYGFLRSETLLPGKKDIYVSVAQIRRYGLRTGDYIEGKARSQRDFDKFAALLYIESLNGREAEENPDRLSFDTLVPIYPNKRIVLESEKNSTNWPIRLVDLIAPIGFGQRAMIVAPPESGKTILLREISAAIKQNDADAHVMMLLIDERPEEVTVIREAVDAEVFASTFDEAPENQTRVSETMLERAERLVEEGRNVVILPDSLTKLTRAYQATLTQGGRAMTNTVTPAALVRP
ncbi:MAG: hypothetical protein PHY12_13645, partial [Eubacteriales bacterium]|nr:hypothetical protein [Eubacteriales bacterium]